jgi:predicted ATPase
MRVSKLTAKNYRSLRDVSIEFDDLNVFIGANASGKSTILDALRFLQEGVVERDFRKPVYSRGGIVHLAWKGQEARTVELKVELEDDDKRFEWTVLMLRHDYEFTVEERIRALPSDSPPQQLLEAAKGEGWWWSDNEKKQVTLKQMPWGCALGAASADASFPARQVAEFVERWGFFDPSPFLLRRDWTGLDSGRFDPYGRNLGETLYSLKTTFPEKFDRLVEATRSVVGLPATIEPRESEDRFHFVQTESGLQFPVHQMGISSGTLRMLALMTALYGKTDAALIGVEEPENYIHPTALASFVEHIRDTRDSIQLLVTTHSPLLLDFLDEPAAVTVVKRDGEEGTTVVKEKYPDGVRRALEASGFGLGEHHETKGFGA